VQRSRLVVFNYSQVQPRSDGFHLPAVIAKLTRSRKVAADSASPLKKSFVELCGTEKHRKSLAYETDAQHF